MRAFRGSLIITAIQFAFTADRIAAFLGQYRTILGTRLACGYFRHSSPKSSEIRQGFPAVFISIDENPDSAIRAPQLCGVALDFDLLRKLLPTVPMYADGRSFLVFRAFSAVCQRVKKLYNCSCFWYNDNRNGGVLYRAMEKRRKRGRSF